MKKKYMYKPGLMDPDEYPIVTGIIAGVIIVIMACLTLRIAVSHPLGMSGNYQEAPISLWLASQSTIVVTQDTPLAASNKLVIKIGKNAPTVMSGNTQGAASDIRERFLHNVVNRNITLRLEGYLTSLHLDLPPPQITLS
jgi:hypothetical protein